MCVLETFLPAYCVGSSVATSECTVLLLKACSRSSWDRLPFVWLTLLIPAISEFDGPCWGLQSLVIHFSVNYASDTDQCVHVKVLELWILFFLREPVSRKPLPPLLPGSWERAFVARAASRTMKDFPLCFSYILLFCQAGTIPVSFRNCGNILKLDYRDVSISLWLYFLDELHLSIIMKKFSLPFSQMLSKLLKGIKVLYAAKLGTHLDLFGGKVVLHTNSDEQK